MGGNSHGVSVTSVEDEKHECGTRKIGRNPQEVDWDIDVPCLSTKFETLKWTRDCGSKKNRTNSSKKL